MRYIDDVLSGEETVCALTAMAVQRHIADLGKKDSLFFYSEKDAARAVFFIKKLRHTSGKYGGVLFNMQPNQEFIVSMLFGWRRKDTGGRRFTQAYIEIARKSGKSELAAAIEIYAGFFEGEEGAQVYTAATTRDQANMVFRAAKKMCRSLRKDSPAMSKAISVMAQSINFSKTDSFIQKVSADAGTLDGLNPYVAVIDEYHAHKTDEVKAVMQTGMGARENPLLLIITTAGAHKDYPCYSVERKNAVAVLSGERTQENLFSIIYTLDPGDDWMDPAIWKKANPNLGSTPTLEYLRQQVKDAQNKGATTRVQVQTKNFNVWVDAPDVWIPEEDIKAVMRAANIADFQGRPVYLGLDLAATSDLTALSVFAPEHNGAAQMAMVLHFLPEATVGKRAADTQYLDWVECGHIITTPGNVCDYSYISNKIFELSKSLDIRAIAYDQWNSYAIAAELDSEGFTMVSVRQTMAYLSEPAKDLEKAITSGEIIVHENPCLAWQFKNVTLDRDGADNIKPNKKRSSEKIDGVAAILNAKYAAMTDMSNKTIKSYLFAE